MGNKGRLFNFDDGKHPPPLDKFFAGWGKPRSYYTGAWLRRPARVSRQELLANARFVGRFLIVTSIFVPVIIAVMVWNGAFRITTAAAVVAGLISVGAVAFGWRLLGESMDGTTRGTQP